MPFVQTDLAQNSFAVSNDEIYHDWRYNTADTIATVTTAGYFVEAGSTGENRLADNDVVFVQASDGQGFYRVSDATAGTVVAL